MLISCYFGFLHFSDFAWRATFTDVYGREFNYTVTNSELLSGWDSPSLIKGGGSDWDLTLFTCTWSGYSRVTVRLVYS